jgi:hypothetical protein
MTKKLVTFALALVLMLTAAPTLLAGDEELDPLLKLLVEQGVITMEQALEVQAQSKKMKEEAGQEKQEKVAAEAGKGFELPKGLKGLSIGTLSYISYQDTDSDSRFTLKRGYINIKKKVTPYLEVRITPDAHQDSSGDWKLRLKYLYAKLKWAGNDVINKPYVEVGLAHMPWLDFEEHINRFRLQDTMFMERNGLFNSADAGFTFGANLGTELPDDYKKTVNDHYAGRWGSFQIGMYNGGGYHAKEHNSNKVIEGRLTVRPMPDALPGLQFSLFGLSGKGNVAGNAPDWDVFTGMVSYESRYFIGTAQYYQGKGNQKGTAVDWSGRALDQDGYSLFTEIRCPKHEKWSLLARYDSFDTNSNDPGADVKKRSIVGLAWQFIKGNYWVIDYDRLEHSLPGYATDDRIQLTLQLKY